MVRQSLQVLSKEIRVCLFSNREFYHAAIQAVCCDGSGFCLAYVENQLPNNTEMYFKSADRDLDLIIIDKNVLRAEWSAHLHTIMECARGVLRVVLLGDFFSASFLMNAVCCGVSGYLSTTATLSESQQALRIVVAGGVWLGHDHISLCRKISPASFYEEGENTRPDIEDTPPPMARALSLRELQILRSIARGNTSKDIADELVLSESSVRTYWYRVLNKLNALNRAEAIALASRLGLLDSQKNAERVK